MFVSLRDVSAAKQVIATLLAAALILWASGAFNIARAANVTSVSDLLSDSSPGADSDHTISFTMSNTGSVSAGGGTIVVTFPAGFDLTTNSVAVGDIDMSVNAVDQNLAGVDWSVAVGASDITFTSVAGSASANDPIVITIGTNSTGGANQIINPTTPTNGNESYEIDISAGTDSGHTRVVILDTVLVTASVATIFDFTVTGTASGYSTQSTTTNVTTSSTTIPFGALTAFNEKIAAQELQVQTNAANGFVVTVHKDGAFQSSTGADIDDFDDGVFSDVPAAWSAPANTINQENTYGHWGVTSFDATTTRSSQFTDGSDSYVSIGTSTSPTVVFSHTGPADNATPGVGSTTVGYQVEISPLQEAGDDYQAILTYIATPTF